MSILSSHIHTRNYQAAPANERKYAAGQEVVYQEEIGTGEIRTLRLFDHIKQIVICVVNGPPITKILSLRDPTDELDNDESQLIEFINYDNYYVVAGDKTRSMRLDFEPIGERTLEIALLGIVVSRDDLITSEEVVRDIALFPRTLSAEYKWGTLQNKNRPELLPISIPNGIEDIGTPMSKQIADTYYSASQLIKDVAMLCANYIYIPYVVDTKKSGLQYYDYFVQDAQIGQNIYLESITKGHKIDGIVTIPLGKGGSTFTFAEEEKVECDLAVRIENCGYAGVPNTMRRCGGILHGLSFPKSDDILYYPYMFDSNNNFDIYSTSADHKYLSTSLDNRTGVYNSINISLLSKKECVHSYRLILLMQKKNAYIRTD